MQHIILTFKSSKMKKIIMAASALLLMAGAAKAEGNATSTNTMQLVVPQILSVTAVPNYQAVYLTETDLNGSKSLQDMVYVIKSNATFNVKTNYASSATYLNNPSPTEKAASLAAFKSAMKFARSTDNLWYDLNLLETLSPFHEDGNTHTSSTGMTYTYHAKLDNLGFNAAPGTYTVTMTVTVTQP